MKYVGEFMRDMRNSLGVAQRMPVIGISTYRMRMTLLYSC